MPLSENEKMSIKTILMRAYSGVGDTGYDMKKCFQKQAGGDIVINYECAKKGGEQIGQKIKDLWK